MARLVLADQSPTPTVLLLVCRLCCWGRSWYHPFDMCVDSCLRPAAQTLYRQFLATTSFRYVLSHAAHNAARCQLAIALIHPILAFVSGTRHLYAAQSVDSGPKQVQYPVVVVNPDNEVECGRKVLLDRTPSAKQDPANYFTSTLLCHNV